MSEKITWERTDAQTHSGMTIVRKKKMKLYQLFFHSHGDSAPPRPFVKEPISADFLEACVE